MVTFKSYYLEVVNGMACFVIDAADAKNLRSAFYYCGEWYIPERVTWAAGMHTYKAEGGNNND